MNVSPASVKRAKIVADEGTPEEIEAVETGQAAISTTARTLPPAAKCVAGATFPATTPHAINGDP